MERGGGAARQSLLETARGAVETEHEHLLHAIESLVARSGENLETQLAERNDALDTFFDALGGNDEAEKQGPQQVLDELSGLVRLPLHLNSERLRRLGDDPASLAEELSGQVETILTGIVITRTLGAIETRLGEALSVDRDSLLRLGWDDAVAAILDAAQTFIAKRQEALTGENGLVGRDLDALLQNNPAPNRADALRILATLAQGRRTTFDAKTHRQVQQVFIRFRYIFLAARLLENRESGEVSQAVLEHLEGARDALRRAWGASELVRLSAEGGTDEAGRGEKAAQLGRRQQAAIHRQVLLGAISEMWVDYLTRVEALRVSIGLEAYAQRDPLVQYKSRASEMFQNLMSEIRTAVVSRVFLYQPRSAAVAVNQRPVAAQPAPDPRPPASKPEKDKKRKRHRH
ncbi:MAG: hypothetical protein FJZ96_03420 [Chloroflexi bacterium]|nr:hypothetical protein [Chloroflexota bacterium]